MPYIFNSVGDVAVFGFLIVVCFCDLLCGIPMRDYYKEEWYREGSKRIWLTPPWWLFPPIWTALHILIITSLYIFYRSVTLTGDFGQTVDVITIVFPINMILNKMWVPAFFHYRSPGFAALICLGILGTGITILAFFGMDNYMNSCWTFLPYVIWTAFALVLNLLWLWNARRESKMKVELTTVVTAKEKDTFLDNSQ